MQALRVGVVSPQPPFNAMPGGLDIDLITALASSLGCDVEFVTCQDCVDFGTIFNRLAAGEFDCVAAAAAVTAARESLVAFLPAYVTCGQALAVDVVRLPNVHSIADLEGLTIGVQRGTTSEQVADRLVTTGRAARVRVYDYHAVHVAITDLSTGGCDAVVKLAPALTELVRNNPRVDIVQRGGIWTEHLAIAVNPSDQALVRRLRGVQAELENDGTLQRMRRKWLGNPYLDQSLVVR